MAVVLFHRNHSSGSDPTAAGAVVSHERDVPVPPPAVHVGVAVSMVPQVCHRLPFRFQSKTRPKCVNCPGFPCAFVLI